MFIPITPLGPAIFLACLSSDLTSLGSLIPETAMTPIAPCLATFPAKLCNDTLTAIPP